MNEQQIISNKTTLGEIDLIVSTCGQTVVSIEHWELAVKFYLAFEGRWLGPNPEDSLYDKLNHMQQHQLLLSDSYAFTNQYPTLHPNNKQMVIQGRLYVNPFLSSSHVNGTRIATNRVTGAWCWKNQIPDKKAFYLLGRDQCWGLKTRLNCQKFRGKISGNCQTPSMHWMTPENPGFSSTIFGLSERRKKPLTEQWLQRHKKLAFTALLLQILH